MSTTDSLSAAAFQALEELRPFSLRHNREVRYWGRDRAVIKMMQRQHVGAATVEAAGRSAPAK